MIGPQVMCYHPSFLPFIVWECLRAPRLNLWGRDRGVGLSVKGQVDELIKAPSDWKSRTSHRKLLASRLGFFDFLGICFCIRIQLLSWLWFVMDCECEGCNMQAKPERDVRRPATSTLFNFSKVSEYVNEAPSRQRCFEQRSIQKHTAKHRKAV